MDARKLLARNLRQMRLERRYSQEALALEAEVDRAYMSGIERGVKNPTIQVLEKLARVLKVSVGELFRIDADNRVAAKPLPRSRTAPRKPKRASRTLAKK